MLPITDDTIDGLAPTEKRYDVPVEDDLHLSVLPNGSKTWVLLTVVDNERTRHSLGVYPDMSILEACSVARHHAAADPASREGGSTGYVLRNGQVVTARKGRPALIVGVVAALAVIVGSAWLMLVTFREVPDSDAAIASAERSQPATGSATNRLDSPLPAVTVDEAVPPAGPTMAARGSPLSDEDRDGAMDRDRPRTPAAEPPQDFVATDQSLPAAEIKQAAVLDEEFAAVIDKELAAVLDVEPAPVVDETPAPVIPTSAPVAEPTDRPLPAADATTPILAVAADADTRTLAVTADDPATTPDADPDAAAPAPAPSQDFAPAAGNVARALLTSDVSNREPTDQLGRRIAAGGADQRRVYFFTELRGMTGSTVVHRWEREGVIQAEVPFAVGGWRWRVFSSKDILAGESGQWQVSVVDENGAVLAERPFEFVAGLSDE